VCEAFLSSILPVLLEGAVRCQRSTSTPLFKGSVYERKKAKKNSGSCNHGSLHKEALFEVEVDRMAHRIELAKHAIFDRMEDVTGKSNDSFQAGEVTALRNAG
jgi:hypothetical protein